MLPLLAASAFARPEPGPSEEIVVYGDDFARWDQTRWWLENELVVPGGLLLAADADAGSKTHALQVRAIVSCDKDARLSAKRWEVSCVIEDIGLLVTTSNDWRPGRRERVAEVLDQIDARLSGSKVQLQVERDGGIANFDVEGLDAGNLRQRQIKEAFRTLASLVMAGFHLDIPDHAQRDGQWIENHTELMDIPSLTAARGSTTVIHQSNGWNGNRLVQSVGNGTVAVGIPYVGTDPFHHTWLIERMDDVMGTTPTEPGGPPGAPKVEPGLTVSFPAPADHAPSEADLTLPAAAGEQRETALEATWSMKLSSVAVFELATGIMTERVWTCSGTPTAGSGGGSTSLGPYLNVGRLWRLGPDESPSVGPTKQVAWPGQQMEGLDPWVALGSSG